MNTIIILLSLFVLVKCSSNYCNLCKDHIGCNNDGKIAEECRSTSKLINLKIDNIQNDIVRMHNNGRNNIALGKINEFKSAIRMPTMSWDNELAKLAEFNVKTCKFEHDKCRKTASFKYSGQNLAKWRGELDIGPKEVAKKVFERFFNEYKYGDMSEIDNYLKTSQKTDHFTLMVSDRNTKLGCGMLQTVNKNITTYVFACNYSTTHLLRQPIYKRGKTASNCTTGINRNYSGLCSPKEQIN